MDYMIQLYFLLSTLPGIYLATKKYFMVIPNPKYNRFIIKLLYCVPALGSLTLILSLFPLYTFILFFDDFTPFLVEKFTIYITLLCPLLTSIFLISILKKYFIRTDLPPEFRPDFMDHELYVFMPHNQIFRGAFQNTKYESQIKGTSNKLLISKQIGNLILDFKILNQINFTATGALVINEEALEIFQKNNLTGYQMQPVSDSNKSSSVSDVLYHQVIPLNTMPSFSTKTIVQSKNTPHLRVFVLNDLFYYNADVMNNVFDFNVTSEILGSHDYVPYLPQRLWVVSKKAMIILLKDFKQTKRDFIPVILVNDENITQLKETQN